MALARYEGVAQDAAGNVIPNASVEVRRDQPGRPVVPLFSDRNGTAALGNPITTNEKGQFGFHLPGGVYYIRVFTGPPQAPFQEYTRRYQAVGTAAERDVEELASSLNAGMGIFSTAANLDLFTPDANNVGARVLKDPDPSLNGDYLYVADEWVKQRSLPDTLARMDVVGGTANAIEVTVTAGVDPANVVMFFLEPEETNTGPVSINGLPLTAINGDPLVAGQFLAGRSYFLTDEGASYRLRQDGDVSGIPDGIAAAAAEAIGQINPLVGAATTQAGIAATKAAESTAARDISVAAKTSAELARDASFALGPKYADEATGRAAVANGATFIVINGAGMDEYKRIDASTSTLIMSYPSVASVDAIVSAPAKMRSTPLAPRRTSSINFLWAVKSRADQVLLGLDRTLRLWTKGLRIISPVQHRTTGGWVFSIGDAAGRAAIGIAKTGRTWLRLTPEALIQLAADLSLAPTAPFRGDAAAKDVHATADLIHARVWDGNWFGWVAQLVGVVSTFALAMSTAAMRGVHAYGQSNTGPSGTSSVAVLLTALFPRHAVAFTAGISREGTSGAVTGSTLNDFTPIKDVGGSTKPDPAVPRAFALEALARDAGEASPAFLSRTDYWGGQALSSFIRDTMMWTNLMTSIEKGREVAAKFGRSYHPSIVWDQGENGPSNQAQYAAEFRAFIPDLRAEVLTRTGITPPFVFVQKANYDTTALPSSVPLAQLDVAKEFDGTSVAMAGPVYQCPLDDVVHLNTLGRMIKGEMEAEVLRRVWREGKFTPLRPSKVTRTGATIVIDFFNPGLPIKLDTDWVLAATNYGFNFTDTGTTATISSVTITGTAQVTIQLSGTPTGANRFISYAQMSSDNIDDVWSSWRGQLYASSGKASPCARLGHAIPTDIRHYAVAFKESV